jgi:predicted Rossmann fold flavoprotein
MSKNFDVIIVGGGAAGFFTAINITQKNPKLKIAILERGKNVLEKVRISGGGRCNVTNAVFEPSNLVKFYPRGEKELLGPFNQFCTTQTIEWFKNLGVELKIEPDGRMFPVSNSSQTIIDCFINATTKHNIYVLTTQSVQSIFKTENHWKIDTQDTNYSTQNLILTTGSNPKMWEMIATLNHKIISAVPSLFTFNISDQRIKNLPGVATPVSLSILDTKLQTQGPLLITHWGMSGPAILKLSAWGARILNEKKYQFTLQINWTETLDFENCLAVLKQTKTEHAKKTVQKKPAINLPNRLWESIVNYSKIEPETKWADTSKSQLNTLTQELVAAKFQVNGKSTFKEEFVTAGGINLKEINFKTMESKIYKNLFFAGEIINVDAITGGFNFQNAWTTGFIVAQNF